jgi:hypothetical protein
MNNEAKAEVFGALFMTEAIEVFVIEDLKLAYELAEPNDWKFKDALREVLKAYLVEKDYQEWLGGQ